MKLASIEKIKKVKKHPNADALDIVCVLGYECIVKKDSYKEGEKIVFIQPDTVLPDAPWAKFYKAKSKRVKAIKLRGEWSFGIVEKLDILPSASEFELSNVGKEVSEVLGVTKYEAPMPQDMSAKGYLPYNIFPTDEERYQNLSEEQLPFGEKVDVTLKIDGKSASYYVIYDCGIKAQGITSRNMDLKLESVNHFTAMDKKYNILYQLRGLAMATMQSVCLRGEIYGQGIQASKNNPHSTGPVDINFYSLLYVDNLEYAPYGEFTDITKGLELPVIPTLETTTLTPELISKYETIKKLPNGESFEGVVIKHGNKSFKIINKPYDEKK